MAEHQPLSRDQQTNDEDDRGVAFTIDAVLTSLLLLTALALAASQMPTNAGAAADESLSQSQLQQDASDVLSVARANTDLNEAVLYWDDSNGRWFDSGSDGLYVTAPESPNEHPLHDSLDAFYESEGISYNIDVIYQRTDGTTGTEKMFYQGTPGPNAAVVSQTITVEDDDQLEDGTELQNSASYFAPDAFPDSNRYNVLRVRIILWR